MDRLADILPGIAGFEYIDALAVEQDRHTAVGRLIVEEGQQRPLRVFQHFGGKRVILHFRRDAEQSDGSPVGIPVPQVPGILRAGIKVGTL